MKKYIIIVALLSSGVVHAQNRNELWTKINITKSINEHVRIGTDIQYRRQNGFEDHNMFRFSMTKSVRLWTFYRLHQSWTIILSPIAYFSNRVVNGDTKETQGATEIRAMIGASQDVTLGKLVSKNRFLYEVSSIKANKPGRSIRQRYRLQNSFIFPLIEMTDDAKVNYGITNELLFRSMSGSAAFDQNRLYSGFQWKASQMDINIGYQYTSQKEEGGYLNKDQLLLVINLNL